ncbi:hypothetical protein DIS24_g186 [Lasiodiplodia hormozganensis]|uniref:Apple domain-containing protein n=1 Tax=Lasiodiplodia hormozganensis TaxID=869390 RepID=A0AA39Z5V4_9PEZI|nr:hypothetical protein DIS24_g186 [Lasiodiplodia hormozganensis]
MIECSQDRYGGDINYFYRKTMELCVELCEQTANCRQVSFIIPPSAGADGTCYLKSSSGAAQTNTNIWGGRKLTDATSSSTTSSAAAASSSASSSGGWNGFPASSGAIACPGSNATVYTVPASGAQFLVLCGFDNNGNNMADNPRWASTSAVPEEMASRCDTTTGCKWATIGGNAAYFKDSVGETYANANVMGIQKVTGSGVTTKRRVLKKKGELPRMRIVKKGITRNGLER